VRPSCWTNRFKTLVEETAIDTSVHVYLCRDRKETAALALPPDSIVVIGDRRSWWPTKEQRFGRWLRSNRHRVMFVDPQLSLKESPHA
jgi:hypothetical protein